MLTLCRRRGVDEWVAFQLQFVTYPSFSTLRLFSPFIFDGSWGRGRAQFNGGISTNCCWMMRWQRNCGMRGNDRGREFCCSNQAVLSFEEKYLQETLMVVNETNYVVVAMILFLSWPWGNGPILPICFKRIQTRGSTINYGISYMLAIPALLTYVAFSHIDKLMFFELVARFSSGDVVW